MSVNYFQTEIKICYLSNDFGEKIACKWFNLTRDELIEKVGLITRGKRKGMIAGTISWKKVSKGGWKKTGSYDWDNERARGFVVKRGLIVAKVLRDRKGETLLSAAEDGFEAELNYMP